MTFTARREAINTAAVPPTCYEGLAQLFERATRTRGGYVTVTVELPRRPRSTGPRSQNHAINGYCQQIAADTDAGFDAVKSHMKQLAIGRGYPFTTLPDDSAAPKSEADISVEEAAVLIDTIKQFADEYGIRLVESEDNDARI
jgi:hypothetical protein